jgi:Tfp pilus assembly protein PilO
MVNIKSVIQPNYLVQRIQYLLRQSGWQALVGLALVIASLSYWQIIVAPQAQQFQRLQKKLAAIEAMPKHGESNQSQQDQLSSTKVFYDALPIQTEANNKISTILRVATDNGLVVNKVEYDQSLSALRIVQYQIKLPITGSYLQIRQFINQVLNSLPCIALSDIRLKRDDIGTDIVDAQIQFTLYLQKV